MTTILVPGKSGQVGWELQTTLAPLGTVIGVDLDQMDLANPNSIRRFIRDTKPGIIVNAAAYTAVDKAESEPDVAMQVNGVAPGIIAEEAKRLGAIFVHYSTDYVFDGELGRPYTEDDAPNPVNTYGKTKLAGERAIEAAGGAHLILRTSGVYSGRGSNFVLTILHLARERAELSVVNDQTGSPTWAQWLAQATAELLRKRDLILHHGGIYHLAAGGHVTRYEFAKAITDTMKNISGKAGGWAKVNPITTDQYPLPARRPRNPIMSHDKLKRIFGIEIPRWERLLRDCLEPLAARGTHPSG